jgi:hypothetical protein
MSTVKATFHLTQSFRFGFEIAYAATMAIDLLKGADRKPVIGNAAVVDTIDGSLPPGETHTLRVCSILLSRHT